MNPVIQVENLGKRYRIGRAVKRPKNLREALQQTLGGPFRYLTTHLRHLASDNQARSTKHEAQESDILWALKNVSFEVQQGEVLGIIGRNGAGKSTLLKILSRITDPTEGRAVIRGRVNSLLEVGTGFHPELTGRENIFMNAALHGMRRVEINRKLGEIIDFAEIDKFIDTPVKRYSSGMYTRLAFAVAAHLDPEILIVDEVLAVGDAEFQKKCVSKMKDVSGQGRTVLFVSHNLYSVKQLCQSCMYLKQGRVETIDTCVKTIERYLADIRTNKASGAYENPTGNGVAYVSRAMCLDREGKEKYLFTADDEIMLRLEITKKSVVKGIYGRVEIKTTDGTIIFETDTLEQECNNLDTSDTGVFQSNVYVPSRILRSGTYFVSLGLASQQTDRYQIEALDSFLEFDVVAEKTQRDQKRFAITSTILKWETHLERPDSLA